MCAQLGSSSSLLAQRENVESIVPAKPSHVVTFAAMGQQELQSYILSLSREYRDAERAYLKQFEMDGPEVIHAEAAVFAAANREIREELEVLREYSTNLRKLHRKNGATEVETRTEILDQIFEEIRARRQQMDTGE